MGSLVKKIKNKIKLFKKNEYINKLIKNGNFINIEKKDLKYINLNITGKNNSVIIKKLSGLSKGIVNIDIVGDNNKVFIDEGICIASSLNIKIGNSHCNYLNSKDIEIKIGKYSTFESTHISAVNFKTKIEIGENCMFANNTKILNSDFHPIYDNNARQIINYVKDLKIGNHCWIGMDSIVLKNVILKDNTIVGAASIVTKSFDDSNIIVAGNPAMIKKRDVNWSDGAHEYCVNDPLSIINVISPKETIEKIIKNKASICRFGDGEFRLLQGKDIDFQKYSQKLQNALKDVLQSDDDNIYIGINYHLFYPLFQMRNKNAFWVKNYIKDNINKIKTMLDNKKIYYSAEFSSLYACLDNSYRHEQHFNNLRKIWNKKDVVLVYGKGIFDNLKYNIFDNANSVVNIEAPNINAFEEYDNIYNEVKKQEKNKLILLILGPTATVLAYNLAKDGYQAIDIGHSAKDYDWYKKGINPDEDINFNSFFKPD